MAERQHHSLFKELSGIVGPQYVSDDDFTLLAYSQACDMLPPQIQGVIVRPGSIGEVVDIVKLANATLTPIIPSGGRGSIYGCPHGVPGRGIVMDMRRMNKLISIDEGYQSVTAQAGISTSELMGKLNEKGWDMNTAYQGFYPDTLGGMLSGCTGGGGGLRMTDLGWNVNGYINSVKVVLGNGDVIQSAGCTNFGKGIAYCHEVGAPCMTPMFIGDAGAFGIKVEATVRIFPKQGTNREVEAGFFDTQKDAFNWYKDMALIDPQLYEQISLMSPYSSKTALMGPDEWAVNVGWRGHTQEIHEAKRKLWRDTLKKHNGRMYPDHPAVKFMCKELSLGRKWLEVGEFASQGRYQLVEAACPLEQAEECFNYFRGNIASRLKKAGVYAPVSECILTVGTQHVCSEIIWYHEDNPTEAKIAYEIFTELFDDAVSHGWVPDITQGFAARKMAGKWKASYVNYMRAIKKALDPNNIINPGVWGEAI